MASAYLHTRGGVTELHIEADGRIFEVGVVPGGEQDLMANLLALDLDQALQREAEELHDHTTEEHNQEAEEQDRALEKAEARSKELADALIENLNLLNRLIVDLTGLLTIGTVEQKLAARLPKWAVVKIELLRGALQDGVAAANQALGQVSESSPS